MDDPVELIERAQAARAVVMADPVPVLPVRRSPSQVRERVAELTTALTAALQRPEAADLTEVARARLASQATDLPQRVAVYYGAHLLFANSLGPEHDAERTRLVKVNRANDRRFMPWVKICFGEHPTLGSVVADIQRHQGHRDDAEDVVRQVELLLNQPLPAGIVLPFSVDELKAAARDASLFLLLLDGAPAPARDAAVFRQKAYARVASLYEELRAFGLLLARADADRDQRFPSFTAE